MEKEGGPSFLKTALPKQYSPETHEKHGALIAKHLAWIGTFEKAALIAYYRSMIGRPDRTAVFRQNKIPVLFVLGKHDQAVPLADGLKQSHLPEVSSVHLLNGSGHMGMLEEPERSDSIIASFLMFVEKTSVRR